MASASGNGNAISGVGHLEPANAAEIADEAEAANGEEAEEADGAEAEAADGAEAEAANGAEAEAADGVVAEAAVEEEEGRTILIEHCQGLTTIVAADLKEALENSIPRVRVEINMVPHVFRIREGERTYYQDIGEYVHTHYIRRAERMEIVSRVVHFQFLPDDHE